jgi:hypothetical protein
VSIHVVTGTTGLVGSAVILELLRQTDVEVIGIVRSHTRPVGERLYAALENAQRAYGYEDGVLRLGRKYLTERIPMPLKKMPWKAVSGSIVLDCARMSVGT